MAKVEMTFSCDSSVMQQFVSNVARYVSAAPDVDAKELAREIDILVHDRRLIDCEVSSDKSHLKFVPTADAIACLAKRIDVGAY